MLHASIPRTLRTVFVTRAAKILLKHTLIPSISCKAYTSDSPSRLYRPLKIAVIGSGPAGFYTTTRLLSKHRQITIDMYESLPTPYGLVRFGVAPDHPEVKNCIDKFDCAAQDPRFRYFGNIGIGDGPGNLPLGYLVPHYDCLLLSYGSSKDRLLNIPGEHTLHGIYSARAFVGWYNGHPEHRNLDPELEEEEAIILGHGNVAFDVARMLLTDMDSLRKTDITEYALERLSRSKVKKVKIIGRRGPLQVSFTIKELRDLLQLWDVGFTRIPREYFPEDSSIASLPRAQRRLAQLLMKAGTATSSDNILPREKSWSLEFFLSPTSFRPSPKVPTHLGFTEFQKTAFVNPADLSPTAKIDYLPESTVMPTSLVFKSIGYLSTPLPGADKLGIPFNSKQGLIPNEDGRVVIPQIDTKTVIHVPGVYTSGWAKRGPTGVIASTMYDAFETADSILQDWLGGKEFMTYYRANSEEVPRGWEGLESEIKRRGLKVVDWKCWKRIEKAEKELGKEKGKEREKLTSVEEMLNVLPEQMQKKMV